MSIAWLATAVSVILFGLYVTSTVIRRDIQRAQIEGQKCFAIAQEHIIEAATQQVVASYDRDRQEVRAVLVELRQLVDEIGASYPDASVLLERPISRMDAVETELAFRD